MMTAARVVAGTALLVALGAPLWGQAAAPAPSKMAAAVLVGSPQGTARRAALLRAIEDWKLLLPGDGEDPFARKYLAALHRIKEDASGLGRGQAVEPLERNFEDWKQALLTELYEGNKVRFFHDPARFEQFMRKRLDAMAAIRDRKRALPGQSKRLDELKAKLGGPADPQALDFVYDKLSARAGLSSAARTVFFSGAQPRAIETVFPAKAVFPTPERIAPPPAAAPIPAAEGGASSFSLTKIIGSVSATARRYAGQVADAIVTYSRRLKLDERLQTALIWVESNFNPRAKSYAGAMGLGQLMPGTARGLGVSDAYDINQNMRGSTVFVKDLMDDFSSREELRYTQGLFAWGRLQVQGGRPANEVFKEVFARTPIGIKNAIAAYNAGPGAIRKYGSYERLPVSRTAYAETHNVGYWQTIHYVPKVLRRYFDVILATPPAAAPALSVSA